MVEPLINEIDAESFSVTAAIKLHCACVLPSEFARAEDVCAGEQWIPKDWMPPFRPVLRAFLQLTERPAVTKMATR